MAGAAAGCLHQPGRIQLGPSAAQVEAGVSQVAGRQPRHGRRLARAAFSSSCEASAPGMAAHSRCLLHAKAQATCPAVGCHTHPLVQDSCPCAHAHWCRHCHWCGKLRQTSACAPVRSAWLGQPQQLALWPPHPLGLLCCCSVGLGGGGQTRRTARFCCLLVGRLAYHHATLTAACDARQHAAGGHWWPT